MPYLCAVIVLTRHDPAQPHRELPPFLVIDGTAIEDGMPDPVCADLLVGCIEDDADQELSFFEQARATGVLNGVDPDGLCSFTEAQIFHIVFDQELSHFVIIANCSIIECSCFVAQVMEAFELPPDERFIEVIVGPVPYTRMDERPPVSPLLYDWSQDRILDARIRE